MSDEFTVWDEYSDQYDQWLEDQYEQYYRDALEEQYLAWEAEQQEAEYQMYLAYTSKLWREEF